MKIMDKTKLILIGILLLAGIFRLTDINWDQNNHLHPDERFLTMVGVAMKVPHSFADYLNPAVSTFNPAVVNYPFYVYGTFPIVIAKLLAINLNLDDYTNYVILGRLLSGLADLFIVLLVFKTAELLEKELKLHVSIKLWSAFFYAIAVLPIQLSHFFAVDSFLNLFVFASFYFMLRFYYAKKLIQLCLSALFLGLAIGSKISAVYIIPLLFFLLVKTYFPTFAHKFSKHVIYNMLLGCLLFCIITYIVARIADPYLFQNGNNFFDPHLNSLFLSNLKSLQSWANPDAWFPPSVQWIHKLPVIFALQNLVIFGIGISYALISLYGILVSFLKDKEGYEVNCATFLKFVLSANKSS